MKLRNLFLPSIALGATILLATPEESTAFSLLGSSLAPNQADFRVFNNFLDVGANDNTTPAANFPGYTGAVMAIWKGAVEWSSGLHGNGNGDPHQPGGLGSGTSSFDTFFNGEATGTGVVGSNIFSSLNLTGGGVLAFQQGGSSGWWIRFYEDVSWSDGPGTSIGFNNFDIQAVACHEYGHAVGLNHSSTNSATMASSIGNGSVSERSLQSDDQAGMRAIYGTANNTGTKPTIAQVINLGGQVRIIGSNFTTNNNEVWFTRLNPGSNGSTPIKVTGASSTNGDTEIVVTIPVTAGPGDIMVKRNSSGQESTSATFPFDPGSVPPPAPMVTSVSPSQVPPLTPTGGALVILTGSGFAGSTGLFVNDKQVGDPSTTFTGSWSIDSDTQISFTMPLTGSVGIVDINFNTPGGPATAQIEITAPSTPTLAVASPLLIQPVGLGIATSSQSLDVVQLQFSVVDGPTSIPGILELEIGNGLLSNIKKAKTWTLGPKFWRKLDSGPITGLPSGLDIYFEGVVLPVSQAYDFPWQSTNKVLVTVLI